MPNAPKNTEVQSSRTSLPYHDHHNKHIMEARTATIKRKTNETEIEVHINLDCQPGSGNLQEISISTGIGFLDHVCPLSERWFSPSGSA